MATIAFAGLKFEVPDDWHNESTLVFSMPTIEGLSTPMAMNPQHTPPTANITVSWEKANGLSAKEFLDLRIGHIPQIFPGFEKQEAGLTDEGMPYAQYKVPAEPPFIQLVCVKASRGQARLHYGNSPRKYIFQGALTVFQNRAKPTLVAAASIRTTIAAGDHFSCIFTMPTKTAGRLHTKAGLHLGN